MVPVHRGWDFDHRRLVRHGSHRVAHQAPATWPPPCPPPPPRLSVSWARPPTPPRPARLPGLGLCLAASTPHLCSPDPRTLPVCVPGRAEHFLGHSGWIPPNLRAPITPCRVRRVTSAGRSSSRTGGQADVALPLKTRSQDVRERKGVWRVGKAFRLPGCGIFRRSRRGRHGPGGGSRGRAHRGLRGGREVTDGGSGGGTRPHAHSFPSVRLQGAWPFPEFPRGSEKRPTA